MRTFEEIEAWQLSRELVWDVYKVSREGVFAKDFGLQDQIRPAAVSIMSNIAEGFERGGNKECINFLSIAKGACGEVRSQLRFQRSALPMTSALEPAPQARLNL